MVPTMLAMPGDRHGCTGMPLTHGTREARELTETAGGHGVATLIPPARSLATISGRPVSGFLKSPDTASSFSGASPARGMPAGKDMSPTERCLRRSDRFGPDPPRAAAACGAGRNGSTAVRGGGRKHPRAPRCACNRSARGPLIRSERRDAAGSVPSSTSVVCPKARGWSCPLARCSPGGRRHHVQGGDRGDGAPSLPCASSSGKHACAPDEISNVRTRPDRQ